MSESRTDISDVSTTSITTTANTSKAEADIDTKQNIAEKGDIVEKSKTPSDYYAPEYILMFFLYFFVSLLYVIHSGVNIPSSVDNWLQEHPAYINMLLATLYAIVSIIYLVFFHLPQDTFLQSKLKVGCTIFVIAMIAYSWFQLSRQTSFSRSSSMMSARVAGMID